MKFWTNILWFKLCVLCSLLVGCNPPAPDSNCPALVQDATLPSPEIKSVAINGQAVRPDSLYIDVLDKELRINLKPAAVDSYYFKLAIKGLNPCGIASAFPQMQYTFLPGGEYELVFWLQKNGRCSPKSSVLIHKKEALTEKAWFYPSIVAYIFLIAGAIVYFWTLYNIRQRLKMQHIRNRIAADLHDEVSADLSSIAISMATLERKINAGPDVFIRRLHEMKQSLAEIQSNLSDTVWAIKPEKDSSGELFQRMHLFAQRMLSNEKTKLIFRNSIPADKPIKLNMEQRHNIFKIYKEAIHNIHKHARATEVVVDIHPHPEGIGLNIQDNGIGFDTSAQRDGNGVSNYFWRAKESLIQLDLRSVPGQGCTIEMVVPEF